MSGRGRGGLRRLAALAGLVLGGAVVSAPLAAQGAAPPIAETAERARTAWQRHDPGALMAAGPTLLVQLPGAEPATALQRDQATALLADFLARSEEVETAVRAARQVESGRAYVELVRRFRAAGTQQVREQTLLLGYRRVAGGWGLVELRVLE